MGWLSMTSAGMAGHANPKAYLDDQFTFNNTLDGGGTRGMRVIDSAFVGNRVWYAAVEIIGNGEPQYVTAMVCQVRWNPKAKDGYVFAYKDNAESEGPCDDGCPARILRLLSATAKEHALNWRRRCLVRLRMHGRKVENGMRLRFPRPISFGDGHSGTEFIVVKIGEKITFRNAEGRGRYRITGFRDMSWTVVPETKVHRTVFAAPTASPIAA
ncbi:hypothetical protein IFT82_09220 [Sphingomonas sp. CFBP 8760]|nr:hypothetical protein [Sphingomonas sp. CFBP 8760]